MKPGTRPEPRNRRLLRFAAAALLGLTLGNLRRLFEASTSYAEEGTHPLNDIPQATSAAIARAKATLPSLLAGAAVVGNATKDDGGRLAIAVVFTLTKEPPRDEPGYLDGAAVLAHSIRTHVRVGSKYRTVHPIALCGPGASGWSNATFRRLQEAGWAARAVDVPVSLDEIEGEFYRRVLPRSGCCGEKELIKLHAFALVEYDRVLLLDADSLLLQPIDELLLEKTDAVFTFDTFIGGNCINGGFAVVTPSKEVYSRIVAIVREGDFREDKTGWAGTHIGWCFGGQTFQGVVSYYYQRIHRTPVVAGNARWRNVDNCVYNNFGMGRCLPSKSVSAKNLFRKGGAVKAATVLQRGGVKDDNAGYQVDTPIEKIKTAHHTGPCKKPFRDDGCADKVPFCVRIADQWWAARYSLEGSAGVEITKRCENGRYAPLRIFSGD